MESEIKDLASLADTYYATRERRLALQREVDLIDKEEKTLKGQIIKALKEGEAKAIGGKTVTVTLKTKNVAVAADWDKIHKYIIENDAWDLMQRRLLQSGIDARWEEGVALPGIEAFPVDELSISKR